MQHSQGWASSCQDLQHAHAKDCVRWHGLMDSVLCPFHILYQLSDNVTHGKVNKPNCCSLLFRGDQTPHNIHLQEWSGWAALVHSSKVAFSLLIKCYNAQNNKAGPSSRKSTEIAFTKPKEIRDERLLGHFPAMICPLKYFVQFAHKNAFQKARDWN